MISNNIRSHLYIDHIVLTVTDLPRTKEFYSKIFGKPDDTDACSVMFNIGATKLFFVLPYGDLPPDDRFNPNRIGLEHLAIGIDTLEDLKNVESALNTASITHSGIHIDQHSKKGKIWLNDPDGIRVEFYIRRPQ